MEIPIQVAVRICPVGLLTNALEKKDEQIPKATADGLTDNNGNVEDKQNETKDSTICNNNDDDEEELDEKDTKCCVQSIPLAAATNMAFLRPNVPGPGIAAGVIQVGPHSFPVTHALPVNCNQHQIYHQTVFPLISLFMEGFDASVVTYGQRQSGKTHTLYGKENMEPGIVQLCISEIFAHISSHPERTFAINIAWVEIYGEVVRDLLGVGSINCMTIQEVFHWMQKGLATLTNSRMEMVHNLFTFSFEQQWVSKEGLIQHRLSTASFTDLCATERLFMLNSLEQPSSLPKDLGLQSLEHVVNTLTDSKYLYNANGDNIPYNQTTLTTLLKDSFGGRAQTLVIFCVSPFERDVNETLCNLQFAFKVQCVRNFVVMNTFSDDNTPLTPEGIMPELPGGLTAGLPPTVNENFGLQFAAGQWFKLVSNAEGLFAKLLQSEVLNDVEKGQVEQWLLLKQESEDCLSSSEVTRSQKPLGPIQEAEEHEETLDQEDTLESDAEETSCRQNSDIDTDTESQRPDIEEKMEQLMEKFQQKTDKLVNERYQDFVEKYPKGVMKSQESLNKRKQEKNQKKQSKQQEEELEKIDDGADDDIDDEEDEGIQEQEDRRPSVTGGGGGGRRRSIQPGASLSSAEIAMLNRVASREQQQSTTCMTKHPGTAGADDDFLDSSSDVPTLRQNINSPCDQIQKKLRKLDTDIEAHLKQIKEVEETMNLKQNIITELIKNSDTRSTAKQRFNKKKAKLEAEFEKTKKALTKAVMQHKERTEIERLKAMLLHLEQRLTDLNSIKNIAQESGQKLKKLQQSLQDSKKLVDDLHKKLKKEKKVKESLEQELKELKEKENNNKALVKHETNLNNKDMDNKGSSSKTNLKEVQSRIAHLDHVLKKKSDNLELYGDDAEQEGLRHEIRNLRKTRDHLLEQRCILDRKLKRDNQLSHKEKRKLLECDEAIEAIDAAIEFKNELICGTKSIDTSERLQREKGEQMLMARLNKLSAEEMRTLLYKYFTKVIDLRDSSRNLEVQLLQLEREKDAWEWKERVLSNAVRQARLEGERNAVLLQRQHEMKLTLMLRHLADETSNSSNVNTSYSDQSMASSIYKAGNNPYLTMQSHLPNSTSSLSDSDFDWSSAATQHQHLHAKHQHHHHHHHALPPQQQASSNIVGHTKSLKSKINDMEMLTIQDPALAKYKPLDKYKDKDRNASGGETKNKLFAKFQVLTRYATNQHDDAVNANGSSSCGGGSKRSNKDKDALALAIPADNLKKLTQNASSTKVTRQKNKLIIQDTRKN